WVSRGASSAPPIQRLGESSANPLPASPRRVSRGVSRHHLAQRTRHVRLDWLRTERVYLLLEGLRDRDQDLAVGGGRVGGLAFAPHVRARAIRVHLQAAAHLEFAVGAAGE